MLKKLLPCFLLLLTPLPSFADTLKSEQEAKRLAERVMASAAKGDIAGAFAAVKPYVVIPDAELQSMVLQSKAQRDQFGTRYGKSIGYEFISERKAGESILRLVYVEKTDKHALPWMFLFYKTPSGWVLNSFAWNDQIYSVFAP